MFRSDDCQVRPKHVATKVKKIIFVFVGNYKQFVYLVKYKYMFIWIIVIYNKHKIYVYLNICNLQ